MSKQVCACGRQTPSPRALDAGPAARVEGRANTSTGQDRSRALVSSVTLRGVGLACLACAMWSLAFVVPTLLPEYPASVLSLARYTAFGLVSVPLAWADREALFTLSGADWWEAFRLTFLGNFIYYGCLAQAVHSSGAPLPTVIVGTLPIVIAVASRLWGQERCSPLGWRQMLPGLLLIGSGIWLVHHSEVAEISHSAHGMLGGATLSMLAVASWTLYALRNAAWLRAQPNRTPRVWATAQGLATLPTAVLGLTAVCAWTVARGAHPVALLGSSPARFFGLIVALGLLTSWVGTILWNAASQLLPTRLLGQLIVFETLSALVLASFVRGPAPGVLPTLGAGLMMAGVILGIRLRPADVSRSGATT
jgi:drug/metabolite transporter (DMT)-like permease